MQTEFWPLFWLKFACFRCHGNRGRSLQIVAVTFKQADPQSPYWMQVSGLCVLCKASSNQFCVKICKFSLPWQRGQLTKFVWHPEMCRLWLPPNWCRFLGYMSYSSWVKAIFVLKFANFRYYGNRGRAWQRCLTTVIWLTLKPPNGCQYLSCMSYTTRVITIFVPKFANFRYHGNRGRSEQFLTVTFS